MKKQEIPKENYFNVLIVDDEKDIHPITKNAFFEEDIFDKPLDFISTFNEQEAIEILKKDHKKISVILLDIVMTTKDGGLKVIEYVRNELNNHLIQIIIRTGQPGNFPKREIIDKYDIIDYIEKGETSDDKLYLSVKSAIRTYNALANLESEVEKKTYEYRLANTKLEQIFNVAVPMIAVNKDFVIIDVNSSFVDLFGGSKEDIMKLKCHKSKGFCPNHENVSLSNDCPVQHNWTDKNEILETTQDIVINNVTHHFQVTSKQVFDQNNKLLYYVECFTDITKEEKVKNELRTLIDTLPSFIYVKDLKCRYTEVNKKFAEYCNDSIPNQLIKKTANDFFDPELCELYKNDDKKVLNGQTIEKPETIKIKGKPNSEIKVYSHKIPLYDEKKNIVGIVGVDFEYNDLLKTIKEIEKKYKESKSKMKAKDAFLSQISHDVSTPLEAITTNTQLIEKYFGELPDILNYLDPILNSGILLKNLIDEILISSQIKEGKVVLNLNCENIYDSIYQVNSIFKNLIKDKGISYKWNITKDVPEYLIIDKQKIIQILINLLSNALKFTKNGYISFSVEIKSVNKNKIELILIVEDTGQGISEENKQKIFNAYDQGQNNYHKGGIGLGLYIVKNYVKLMKGKIDLESELNEGSKFTISIPGIEVIESKIQPDEKKINTKEIVFEKSTLLVVDDLKDIRTTIKNILKHSNIEVLEAENGKEGIDMLKKESPDLILMDIEMPVMEGREATRIIKDDDKYKHIPIIAYTNSLTIEEIQELDLFDDFLHKDTNKQNGDYKHNEEVILLLAKYLKHSEEPKFSETISITESITKNINTSQINKPDLTTLVSLLEFELSGKWSDIKKYKFQEDIKEFCEKIEKISQNKSYEIIKDYSEQLSFCFNNYKINKLNTLLNNFPEVIKLLKNKKNG